MSKISIIGCGNMGYAILCGIVRSGKYLKEDIFVSDKSEACRQRAKELGVNISKTPAECVSGASLIILAVKPNVLDELAKDIASCIPDDAVIASILAGKTISTLEEKFGSSAKIIRIMPNTPALVGMGMSGVCSNNNVSEKEIKDVVSILAGFGEARVVPESLMDTVTGISGSGPAYVFMFIDGLMRSAVKHGMTEADAKLFAAQTVAGAAKMVMESENSPDQLKINVCSPGGTTIEAVKVFEEMGLYDIIDKAVDACVEKSRKMSKN